MRHRSERALKIAIGSVLILSIPVGVLSLSSSSWLSNAIVLAFSMILGVVVASSMIAVAMMAIYRSARLAQRSAARIARYLDSYPTTVQSAVSALAASRTREFHASFLIIASAVGGVYVSQQVIVAPLTLWTLATGLGALLFLAIQHLAFEYRLMNSFLGQRESEVREMINIVITDRNNRISRTGIGERNAIELILGLSVSDVDGSAI